MCASAGILIPFNQIRYEHPHQRIPANPLWIGWNFSFPGKTLACVLPASEAAADSLKGACVPAARSYGAGLGSHNRFFFTTTSLISANYNCEVIQIDRYWHAHFD